MNLPPPILEAPPRQYPRTQSNSLRPVVAVLLSVYIVVFLTDAVVSLADDSLITFAHVHVLGGMRGWLALAAFLMSLVTYGLMGLTPMIPKRLFLPLTMFYPVATLIVIPILIHHYDWLYPMAWVISLGQVALGIAVLHRAQGGFKRCWPLVAEEWIGARRFRFWNLAGFVLVNGFVLLPGAAIYLLVSAALAVDHFSEGFVTLRPGGLKVQARRYVRDDGKMVQLIPMSHVGDRGFYRMLSESFTTNSIILMEGVTDEKGLLTNRISYKRMAKSLGVVEQQKEFKPAQGEMIAADVDVGQFTTNTIGFLNLITLLQAKGLNAENVMQLLRYSPPAGFEEELMDDLLRNRNRHVVEELRSRLSQSEKFVVPWGAGHMPGIAREILKLGFRLEETREFTVIGFRGKQSQADVSR